ncbi:MAG: hypothetical protein AAGC54_04900 [Cyanobacteria bacterium P01_F01_bin.4]
MSAQPSSETTHPPISSEQFSISPLIRITLLGFYSALVLPLPFLATVTDAPIPAWVLWIGLLMGGLILYGGLSERVELDDTGIRVTYPGWIRWLLRRGWSLQWSEIQTLKPRSTGQGGLVYYFLTPEADRAYLLPMRVVGFSRLVQRVEANTGIDTRDIKPLAQPWMYFLLLLVTLLLLLVDIWTIGVAVG